MKKIADDQVIDHKRLLIQKIQSLESRYNPEVHLLRSPFSSPGYHTTIRQAEFIHSTRDSLSYALGLLDTELEIFRQRALDVIQKVVSLQDTDPGQATFGIWPWFYEEPLAQMSPPDWNWADFCGSRLVLALSRHGSLFPEDLRESVAQSISYACEAIIKRDVGPDYTNIAILGAFVTRIAGEWLHRTDYADYGLQRLRKLYDFTRKRRAFQEYNSPVYTPIAILELSKLRAETSDEEVRRLSGELLDWTWKTVAEHYHPGTGQWSGPHSRSYDNLLTVQCRAFLQMATVGAVKFFPWESLPYEEEWYQSGVSCPLEYLHGFTDDAMKELKQLYQGEAEDDSGRWASTYITPQYSLGTFSDSDMWNQRRPLLAYFNNGEDPASLRLRVLHDGYDYCSARFTSLQQQSQVLFGIDFLTDGGDTHPNLDRIDGEIEAEDFRLRLELGGCICGAAAEAAEAGAAIAAGGLEIRLRTWFAAFEEDARHRKSWVWEVSQTEEVLALDLILYAGPRRKIDFRKLRQAAFVCSLSMEGEKMAAPPLLEVTTEGVLKVTAAEDNGSAGAGALYLNLRPAAGSVL